MRIILRDAHTGEILATGLTQGGTGNTKLIMHEDRGRRAQLADESAAKFAATLDLDEPKGLWDADKLEVKAIVKRNGERVADLDLAFAGETSQFATQGPRRGAW